MISITRLFRLGVRVAEWATPHVQEWHRRRHLNSTEGRRHLECRNWTEAEKHLALALAERRGSAKRRVELLLGLGKAQRHQHKLDDAEHTALQAKDVATKARDHAGRSLCMEALVDVQIEQTKYREAEQTIKVIQHLEESRSKPDYALLARCARKLASAFLNSGREAEAVEAFGRAADLSERSFGPNHAETASTLAELGALYRQRGNHIEAQRCIRRALQIHRAALGADSREATEDLKVLATSLEESGDLNGAMGEYERVLALRERQVGGNREDTAETQVRLAILYLQAERTSAARELLTHAVGTLERTSNESLATALEALAITEERAGRMTEAGRWRDKASKMPTRPVSNASVGPVQ